MSLFFFLDKPLGQEDEHSVVGSRAISSTDRNILGVNIFLRNFFLFLSIHSTRYKLERKTFFSSPSYVSASSEHYLSLRR
jgi:hypothetical protein